MKIFYGSLILVCAGVLLWSYCGKDKPRNHNSDTPISFILFDFDGTIADSFDTAVTLCNKLSDEYGFAKITAEQRSKIMHMSMKDIITKHLKIPWYRLLFFHKKILSMVQ